MRLISLFVTCKLLHHNSKFTTGTLVTWLIYRFYLHLLSLCRGWTTSASSCRLSFPSCRAIPHWRGSPPLVHCGQCRTSRRRGKPCDFSQGTRQHCPFATEERWRDFFVLDNSYNRTIILLLLQKYKVGRGSNVIVMRLLLWESST